MQEIKCPKCGEVFQVDESGYAAIVRQVRDKEFEKELSERKAQYLSEKENAELAAIIINMNLWTRLKLAQGATPAYEEQESRANEAAT